MDYGKAVDKIAAGATAANVAKAAGAAGATRAALARAGRRIKEQLRTRDEFREALAAVGATAELVATKLRERLEATRTIRDKDGNAVDEEPAYDAQDRAAKLWCEIYGLRQLPERADDAAGGALAQLSNAELERLLEVTALDEGGGD